MASIRTHGSSALSVQPAPKRQPVYVPTPQERRRIEHQRRMAQQRRLEAQRRREAQQRALARVEAAKKFFILVYVLVLFAVLGAVVVGYARIAAVKMENNAIAKQIEQHDLEIASLEVTLTQKTDLQVIRQQAQERLSMGYPKAYQILEIDLGDAGVAGGETASAASAAK
jgi:cell division protein FtsL